MNEWKKLRILNKDILKIMNNLEIYKLNSEGDVIYDINYNIYRKQQQLILYLAKLK